MSPPLDELLYDWNEDRGSPPGPLVFDDETLRDGLQSPSVRTPSREQKVRFLHLMAEVGIGAVDVGLPGAGSGAAADAEALCREIVVAGLPLAPNCAARTVEDDVVAALEVMQRVGRELEIMLFTGATPLRCYVEGWPLEELQRRAERCVDLAVRGGAPVAFVIEDTTRSQPEDLRRLVTTAVRAGAHRVCIADTAGYAIPCGAERVVAFVRDVVTEIGGSGIGLDWHGHNDRGLAVANALAAARAGVSRIHATVLGVGERVGNPPMEQLLVNARLLGWAAPNLSRLMEYITAGSEILGVAIPPGAAVAGRDAFRTTTGVHASAIVKAGALGDDELADMVYSAVPAAWLERQQEIEVGPVSGGSNVRYWLLSHGYVPEVALVRRILAAARAAHRTLTDQEVHAVVRGVEGHGRESW